MARIKVDEITNLAENGNVSFPSGGASFQGNVSVGGVLTYEDVTNVDSVGVVTARSGVITPNVDVDDFISVGSNIHLGNAGIITASSFVDDGTNLLTEINTKATTGKAIAMAMIFG